jgi:hypothetical protein
VVVTEERVEILPPKMREFPLIDQSTRGSTPITPLHVTVQTFGRSPPNRAVGDFGKRAFLRCRAGNSRKDGAAFRRKALLRSHHLIESDFVGVHRSPPVGEILRG